MGVWPHVLFALFLHGTLGAVLNVGNAGNAVLMGNTQGMYCPDFPMPATTITVDTWVRAAPVRSC